jgi:SOS response regulatory protein OraA/RecX
VRRRSRASAADGGSPAPPVDPYGLALGWLSARQVQQRLARRGVAPADIDAAIARLTANGVLDETRMALAAARLETVIRGRGPARTRQKLRALGLPDAATSAALEATLADVDLDALLDRALEIKLRKAPAGALDQAATRRIVGALVRQGFDAGSVFKRLRQRGARAIDSED